MILDIKYKILKALVSPFNPLALRLTKSLWSFGQSECNRVKTHWLALSIVKSEKKNDLRFYENG